MIDLSPTQANLYNEVVINDFLKVDGQIIVGTYAGESGWTYNGIIAPAGADTFIGQMIVQDVQQYLWGA